MNTNLTPTEYLRSYGIKPSVQRIAIMEYMLANRIHPTADDIYNALCEKVPTLSRTTVYNTMKLFADHKAVRVLTIDEKNARFDVEMETHAHFQCCVCGRIYDIHPEDKSCLHVTSLGEFEVTESQLSYRGYCPYCKQENMGKVFPATNINQ